MKATRNLIRVNKIKNQAKKQKLMAVKRHLGKK